MNYAFVIDSKVFFSALSLPDSIIKFVDKFKESARESEVYVYTCNKASSDFGLLYHTSLSNLQTIAGNIKNRIFKHKK